MLVHLLIWFFFKLKVEVNKATSQTLLITVSMMQPGQSSVLPHPIDNDSHDRIVLCMRLLCNTGDEIRKIWMQSCRQSFVKMLADKQRRETEEIKAKAQISNAQPDDLIDFYHLKSRKAESMKKKLPWLRYDMKQAEYREAKEREKTAAKSLKRLQNY
ncbi:unnamed protein product [Lathyrus sativus]|nr:unnamed protein product [Lathyrus sativus]